jgi:uncharacterized membrane protein
MKNKNNAPAPQRWLIFRAHPRLAAGALAGAILLGILVSSGLRPVLALLLSFDGGVLIFLASTVMLFNRAAPDAMHINAVRQDLGRWAVLWTSIVLSVVILVALWVELRVSKNGGALAIVIACGSIILSWLYMNTIFAVHYAHGYYGNYDASHKGLDFPGDEEPDYWDFAYFAIVIGMTFQVSDVQITSRHLRRMALLQSVIAFFLNVFIIAMTVNIVAGQA